jgi:peptidoglycan/LPS O-acetylase OafA/YrhL
MRSSSGNYYPALDHVRAIAAFMTVSWHTVHGLLPFDGPPLVAPLVFMDQGYTGVSLFMTLSGYLFAKILDGKRIAYREFMRNRLLRLGPLLIIYFVFTGLVYWHEHPSYYLRALLYGLVQPRWPGVSWSLTAELHCYLLLPAILYFTRRNKYAPLLFVGAMLAIRIALHLLGEQHGIQWWSYFTIVGRADQFLFGIAAFQFAELFRKRHLVCLAIATALTAFLWSCDYMGGYYAKPPLGALWIIIPTVEGLCYSALIAYYDTSFSFSDTRLSRFLALAGTCSYSIYLFHYEFITMLHRVLPLGLLPRNFYFWCAMAVIVFVALVPLGYLSFRFIESPFLKLRGLYVRPLREPASAIAVLEPQARQQ